MSGRYVFTQQHRDNLPWWNSTWLPQTIPDGAALQIQLPATPVVWKPDLGPGCQPSDLASLVPTWVLPLRSTVTLTRTSSLPDDGRISGTSTIAVFDFQVRGIGIAALCLRPDPTVADPTVLGFPPGTPSFFVLTLLVGVPQLSLP